MKLTQLIYSSLPAIPIGTMELVAILEPAQARNRHNQVTGLLAYSGTAFLQLLEGDETVVQETYARILKDTRHREIRLLGRLHPDRRAFAEWSMGYAGFRTFKREVVERYSSSGTLDCASLGPETAMSLLLELGGGAIASPTSV